MDIASLDIAGTPLADLVARAEAGEEIVLTRDGRTVARLVPCKPEAAADAAPKPRRVPGAWKGIVTVGPEFFEPLPEEELKLWE